MFSSCFVVTSKRPSFSIFVSFLLQIISGAGFAVRLHSKCMVSPSFTTCALGLLTIDGASPSSGAFSSCSVCTSCTTNSASLIAVPCVFLATTVYVPVSSGNTSLICSLHTLFSSS
ncbi:hypothetical protein NP493_191g02004 [Ridgeia piscesae]|uniref:Uncharacterized protein n=1 Tax=Ridgeia piscesae TaxID=27915 RepID=A0AAD9P219_RIDPI|nr:hypothetical protein NP493_191g02004 [Ridgeia piscesae]